MKKQFILQKFQVPLEQMGENIKLARKRRKLSAKNIAELAGVTCSTLFLIEKGDANITIGAYFNVLRVLGLQEDILRIAANDIMGLKLQNLELL